MKVFDLTKEGLSMENPVRRQALAEDIVRAIMRHERNEDIITDIEIGMCLAASEVVDGGGR